MIIVIDGYNVLKYKGSQSISQEKREQYIQRISTYCYYKQHCAWIVFDGGVYFYPVTFSYDRVCVVYSGEHESADTTIQRLLYKQPVDNTVLVSSDNEIAHFAIDLGMVSIDASVFSYYVNRALKPQKAGYVSDHKPAQKRPGHESTSYVDRLMEMASEHVLYKEEDMYYPLYENNSVSKKTLSSQEKEVNRILKKL